MGGATRPRAAYSLTDATPARTIWVYRNGDPYYLGRKFIINHRYVPNFEAFMIQLNEGVPTPFGVRNLYTPRYGHSVMDLPDLEQGGRYVAAVAIYRGVECYVFTNGEMLIPPIKILIPKFTLKSWNSVLGLINEKVCPRSGGIHRLYTLSGQCVQGPDDLEDNQFYVGCGKEKFQPLPYWQHPRVPEYIRRFQHPEMKTRTARLKAVCRRFLTHSILARIVAMHFESALSMSLMCVLLLYDPPSFALLGRVYHSSLQIYTSSESLKVCSPNQTVLNSFSYADLLHSWSILSPLFVPLIMLLVIFCMNIQLKLIVSRLVFLTTI
uniref:Doublecortin domain containing 2C n=1 Tax=Varanus komodoensis TaxID=61221 RepID=A0A8D2KUG2_VARKO